LDIAGESQTTFETSAGQDVDSKLNLGATGREDVTTVAPKEEPKPAEQPAATPAPKPEPPKAVPSGAAGSVIQLGAFANRAQAERAWTALSSRFSSVAGLSKMIVPFSGGIRLRAAASSPAEAQQVCNALKAAGEACFVAR
jgi:cell division protein FtsN